MEGVLVLQLCKCQTLVFLIRSKSDTLERNWCEFNTRGSW